MGFSVNVDSLPSIRDWQNALFTFQCIKPIRGNGKNGGVRPLGNRRAGHMEIHLLHPRLDGHRIPEGKPTVCCRLYNTDCVMFYPDGRIHLDYGVHNTRSTIVFINKIISGVRSSSGRMPYISSETNRVLGPRGYVENKTMLYHLPVPDYKTKKVFPFPTSFISLDADGVPLHPITCKYHKVNRKAANALRKLYKPFIDHAKVMIKLSYSDVSHVGREEYTALAEELTTRLGLVRSTRLPNRDIDWYCKAMRSTDRADWSDALHALGVLTVLGAHSDSWSATFSWRYQPKAILRQIDEIIKHAHRDQIFVEEELPIGEYKKDLNLKYVNSL